MPMTWKQLGNLKRGDIVRHDGNGETYVIICAAPLIACQTVCITNYQEWSCVRAEFTLMNTKARDDSPEILRSAIACLNSMILSGEQHTEESCTLMRRALEIINMMQ